MNKLKIEITALVLFSLSFLPLYGENRVTQSIQLQAGWNSVWLEVQPTVSSGEDIGRFETIENVFNDPGIELVTTPKNVFSPSDYKFDPTNTGLIYSEESWQVWRKNPVVNANSLLRVTGNRPYLIKVADSAGSVQLNVTGAVRYFDYQWKPDSHNLLGFGIDETNPPSFQSFFSPAATEHSVSEIFYLKQDGTWAQVTPSSTMKQGTAYWIYANGESDYAGPLSVGFTEKAAGILNFGSDLNSIPITNAGGNEENYTLRQVTFTSLHSAPLSPVIEKVTPSGLVNTNELRLYRVRPEPNTLDYRLRSAVGDAFPVVESDESAIQPNSSKSIYLGASRHWTAGGTSRVNVYKVKTSAPDGVSYRYLPVTAQVGTASTSSVTTPNANYTGLWQGNVSLDQVSSITETGSPLKETEASAPMKILLHSDGIGGLHLLSQVTWMQETSASAQVSPGQVLVLNTDKIPFYEGVEERAGKKVGRRVETVSYDMPRVLTTAAQAALLTEIFTESQNPASLWSEGRGLYATSVDVTENAVESYLNFISSRPPSLQEDYEMKWPLSGQLSPGFMVETAAPLTLDPYHRSNPFRHAFHPKHGKGKPITRVFQITLDPNQTSTIKLNGTFTETTTGITREPILSKGPVTLYRINAVPTLIE